MNRALQIERAGWLGIEREVGWERDKGRILEEEIKFTEAKMAKTTVFPGFEGYSDTWKGEYMWATREETRQHEAGKRGKASCAKLNILSEPSMGSCRGFKQKSIIEFFFTSLSVKWAQ